MSGSNRFDRREFIQAAASMAVAGSMGACARSKPGWNYFTPDEVKLITALCEQIIPADNDPGADWAGVPHFIDFQLVGPYLHLQETYRLGLKGVNESSVATFTKRFADLPFESQTEVLQAMEKGEAPGETWQTLSSMDFFDMLIDHTQQGFYGDPRHGGNQNAVSWAMLGIPHPPIRGRQHYDLSGNHKSDKS